MNPLRAIPAVDKVLAAVEPGAGLPRPLVVAETRAALEELRRSLAAQPAGTAPPSFETVVAGVQARLEELRRQRLRPVLNATGVVLHTNLGRAPMGADVRRQLAEAAGYGNLELDLATGRRGRRGAYLERCLALLCEAEAATVVNNGAAALVLILRHLARPPRNEVIVSRGELVQIGGGFRIPEILEASGAVLREVGTTNRTELDDYAAAVGERSALILKVHRSNFFMEGFVQSPSIRDLVLLARHKGLPLVEDLGSGAVVDTRAFGLQEQEPSPAASLRAGVDLVCFSGDKLLGGPQAGIVAGKGAWIAALKREPFFRALRCDKLILAALQATVEAALAAAADPAQGPLAWQLLATPVATLRRRAQALLQRLAREGVEVHLREVSGRVGGGTLPRAALPSVALEVRVPGLRPEELASRLRRGDPPVVGVIEQDALCLDLRTVPEEHDAVLAEAVRAAVRAQAEKEGRGR